MKTQEITTGGILFHLPHSRTLIPDYSGMDMRLIDKEIRLLTDHHTEDIFYVPGIEQLVFPFSRIFCDVERLPDAEEPMFAKGKGFFYTHADDGMILRTDEHNIRERVYEVYLDHHRKLHDMVRKRLDNAGMCVIIDCHSFPGQVLTSDADKTQRPDICIGTDDFHTPEYLIKMISHNCEKHGFKYKINSPYTGTIIPSQFFQKDSSVIGAMIEINRDLYMKDGMVDFYKVSMLNQFIRDIF